MQNQERKAELFMLKDDSFQEINVDELCIHPHSLFSTDWLLITTGNQTNGYNTMTACWGQLGAIWGHGKGLPTATVFIRPQRYTKEFIDREDTFTLSFFTNEYKKQLAYLGTHSGKVEDKISKVGFTPIFLNDTTYIQETKLVLVCRKIYVFPLKEEGFIDKSIMKDNYPKKDYHTMYIEEIQKVLIKN